MKLCDNVSFGIAGWSYSDWAGIVYPGGVGDKLEFVSRYVDCIEINSSFYRPPSARAAGSWARRVSGNEDFFFTAKLPRDITHHGLLSSSMISSVRDGFAPLIESNMLRHLLAQFRYDFSDSSRNRAHVAAIASSFSGLSNITFELRHKSWQNPSCLAWLESLGATVANLDYPTASNSFDLSECLVGRHRYLRLHGRNAKAWFDKNAGRDETYNYYYSQSELNQIAARASSLAETAGTLTVIANNHFEGKELANILQLKAIMTGEKLDVPAGLLARYAGLNDIALKRQSGLFEKT